MKNVSEEKEEHCILNKLHLLANARTSLDYHPNHLATVRKEIRGLILQIQRKPTIACKRGVEKKTNQMIGLSKQAFLKVPTDHDAAKYSVRKGSPVWQNA